MIGHQNHNSMNKIINIIGIISILFFLGCNPEKKYLEQHTVIICELSQGGYLTPQAVEYEKKRKVSFNEVNLIYTRFLIENNELDASLKDSVEISYPSLIIDDYYVYSFYNEKLRKYAVSGVWIDSNTGELKINKDNIWLEESMIEKDYKKEEENKEEPKTTKYSKNKTQSEFMEN